MSYKIIDGKKIAANILKKLKEKTDVLTRKNNRKPCLAVVLVGSDPASTVYVAHKRKSCENARIWA